MSKGAPTIPIGTLMIFVEQENSKRKIAAQKKSCA
jgi:hypothetical protein